MLNIKDIYKWEIETEDGLIYTTKSNQIDSSKVIRVSFIPTTLTYPKHDIITNGYVRRFCRGFFNLNNVMNEYLHCVVYKNFRVYLKSSNGQCLITPKDYDLYL